MDKPLITFSPLRNDDREEQEGGRAMHFASDPARSYGMRSEMPRSDAAIEEEIWNRILKDRGLGPGYRENIAVDVDNGCVKLRGHVTKPWHSHLIAEITGQVVGVQLIKNELVADNILQQQVIRALLQDETTSPYIFQVRSSYGWINLKGLVPGQEIATTAEMVAVFVPHVRGILSLPTVFGMAPQAVEDLEAGRRTLQPRILARVYQDESEGRPQAVGMVSQVVIDPGSRLVTAIAVRLCEKGPDAREAGERLIPIAAVEAAATAANESKVWLKEGETPRKYPLFERRMYPLPPSSWRPPFPYQPGMVRWSL